MTPPSLRAILIVEDEPLILFDAVDMVEDEGFKAFEAKNADEALSILETNSAAIDLLFTDIDMPGTLDGLMLAQTVRRRWPHIAIVVVSGHMHPTAAELPYQGRFVPKPYVRSAIMRAMRESMTQIEEE